ncbi:MAG TPA: hypothetical protein DCW42_08200 [Bacteroidetes bacterium]|jgi:precorrin-6B methylase 1|nr:hypothetical protein [Bacteroidota bacterium]
MKNEIIHIGDIEFDTVKHNIPRKQIEVAEKASQRIVGAQSKLQFIERDITRLRTKIAESQESKELKKLKQQRKTLTAAVRDSSNVFNGVLETLLAEIPGATLQEKQKYLKEHQNES